MAADIESGDIVLRKLDERARWNIIDIGSCITAAGHAKHYASSKLEKGDSTGEFFTATGKHVGTQDLLVNFAKENNHPQTVEVLNAEIAIQFIFEHLWNQDGHNTLTDEYGGLTIHTKTSA